MVERNAGIHPASFPEHLSFCEAAIVLIARVEMPVIAHGEGQAEGAVPHKGADFEHNAGPMNAPYLTAPRSKSSRQAARGIGKHDF